MTRSVTAVRATYTGELGLCPIKTLYLACGVDPGWGAWRRRRPAAPVARGRTWASHVSGAFAGGSLFSPHLPRGGAGVWSAPDRVDTPSLSEVGRPERLRIAPVLAAHTNADAAVRNGQVVHPHVRLAALVSRPPTVAIARCLRVARAAPCRFD